MKWEGELYLELHNGTYTSMAENKLYNRKMEVLFRDLEIISSFAQIIDSKTFKYDIHTITEMW